MFSLRHIRVGFVRDGSHFPTMPRPCQRPTVSLYAKAFVRASPHRCGGRFRLRGPDATPRHRAELSKYSPAQPNARPRIPGPCRRAGRLVLIFLVVKTWQMWRRSRRKPGRKNCRARRHARRSSGKSKLRRPKQRNIWTPSKGPSAINWPTALQPSRRSFRLRHWRIVEHRHNPPGKSSAIERAGRQTYVVTQCSARHHHCCA